MEPQPQEVCLKCREQAALVQHTPEQQAWSQVDALGLVGQLLDHVDAGFKPKPKEVSHERGPIYVAGPDGRASANIDLLKYLEAKRKRRDD